MAQHWTETVTDSLSLAQAFMFDHNPMKGDKATHKRAESFAARCTGGVDMFWAALEAYMGRSEVKRLRAL